MLVTAPDLAFKAEGWDGRHVLVGTGQPKDVALSHGNLLANGRSVAALYELDRERWALATLPLAHSCGLGLTNASAILGTRAVLLRWFTPEGVLAAIERYRVQQMSGVPMVFVALPQHPEADRYDTSSMRLWGSGAAPLPVRSSSRSRIFGGRLLEGYDLTEAAPPTCASPALTVLGSSTSVATCCGRRWPRSDCGSWPPGACWWSSNGVWADGTSHLLFEPLEFLEKLAALTPPPADHG